MFLTAPNCDLTQKRERSYSPFKGIFFKRWPLVIWSYEWTEGRKKKHQEVISDNVQVEQRNHQHDESFQWFDNLQSKMKKTEGTSMSPDMSWRNKPSNPVVLTTEIIERTKYHSRWKWYQREYDLPLPRGPVKQRKG